jgi:hypothetical protein
MNARKEFKWDYRFLSLLLAGVLGFGADLIRPDLKSVFCSASAGQASVKAITTANQNSE